MRAWWRAQFFGGARLEPFGHGSHSGTLHTATQTWKKLCVSSVRIFCVCLVVCLVFVLGGGFVCGGFGWWCVCGEWDGGSGFFLFLASIMFFHAF